MKEQNECVSKVFFLFLCVYEEKEKTEPEKKKEEKKREEKGEEKKREKKKKKKKKKSERKSRNNPLQWVDWCLYTHKRENMRKKTTYIHTQTHHKYTT